MPNFSLIQEAEMEMSANDLVEVWESDIDLTEDDMCDQLDALLRVMEGKASYADFQKQINITTPKKWLH